MLNSSVFYRICFLKSCITRNIGIRSFLSEAYSCEDAWKRRLIKAPLKDIKMNQYFIEVDKKFVTKRLASGIDIDMFANKVTSDSQLDELEHLLYRFRRTKRAAEMMESTHCAVVRAFLKFDDYDSLFRILTDRINYGVFPDPYTYNLLMDTFLKQDRYRDAAEIAVLMMLQEDFSNSISRVLSLYSCYQFLNSCPVDSFWNRGTETEVEETDEKQADNNEDDEEEETLIRIPYLRNPWFDDHFEIKDPKQLLGKTLYLNGRQENNILGWTSQIVGLGMYGKWNKAVNILETILNSESSPQILEEGVLKFKEIFTALPEDDEMKNKFSASLEDKFSLLKQKNKICTGDIMTECKKELERIPKLETQDIREQEELFNKWEQLRQTALSEQENDIDREERLKIIAKKKEELYWKEKLLFFFENKEQIMEELEAVEKIIEEQKSKKKDVDTYVPPEIIKKKPLKISILRRKAMVKAL